MRLLDRYLLGKYLAAAASTLGVLLAGALVLEFLEKARVLLGEKSSAADALWLMALRLPQLGGMLLPVALVLGVSLANARMGRSLEFRALAAAGVGWRRLLVPLGLAGGLAWGLSLANAEWLSAPAAAAQQRLQQEVFGWLDDSWQFFRQKHWFRGEPGRIFQVVGNSENGREVKNLHLFQLDDDFVIERRVHLTDASWTGTGWRARGAEEWIFRQGLLVENRRSRDAFYAWPEGPERFRPLSGSPRSRRLAELLRQADEIERRGLDASAYRLEAHQRAAYPACGLLLLLLAFPWQVSPRRRQTAARALLGAAGLILLAYVLVAACTTAVGGGLLEPWQGAWLPPLLLAGAAAGSFVRWSRKGAA